MTLGEKIVEYREEHQLSLRAFSRLTGLSPTYISYLEKGETHRGKKPAASIDTYKSIAKAMGISTDDLVRSVEDIVAINTGKKEKSTEISELSNMSDDDLTNLFMQLMAGKDKDYLLRLASKILEIASKKES